MPRKPKSIPVPSPSDAPTVRSFDEAMKAVNVSTTRRGPAQGSLHYPWLAGAGALVDMMDRIFDVNGMKSRPVTPVRAIKYSLKRQKKWSAA